MREKNHGIGVTGAAAVAVGMVVGAGLFKSPALVAAYAGTPELLFGAWLLGGVLSILGALCYSELAAAYPNKGGDYFFLTKAYGRHAGFLFAWARFAVINTGSIALLGFVLGDYLNALVPLGQLGSAFYAAIVIVAMTGLNLSGRSAGLDAQLGMTLLLIASVLALGCIGLLISQRGLEPLDTIPAQSASLSGFGSAMVFVMLAYGGWSEVATLSTEVKDQRLGMLKALVLSMVLVTGLYLVINWALWRGLGLGGLAASSAPAADMVGLAVGGWAQIPVVLVVSIAVITSINATILVGGRTTFAAARDWPALSALAKWEDPKSTPSSAILAQSLVAVALVGLGAWTRQGFATLVDYTAPVYWLFITMSGIALMVLRVRDPQTPRPFQVPIYPLLPLLFIGASLFVLYSSIAYVRVGALVGMGVLALGLLTAFLIRKR